MYKINNSEFLAICNELITSAKHIFPQHAEIDTQYDSDRLSFVCTIHWKLNNDPKRPNKPSRIILIIIPREVIEDSRYEFHKQSMQEKLKNCLEKKFKQFNPDHNEPYGLSPPRDEWIVYSHDINK